MVMVDVLPIGVSVLSKPNRLQLYVLVKLVSLFLVFMTPKRVDLCPIEREIWELPDWRV